MYCTRVSYQVVLAREIKKDKYSILHSKCLLNSMQLLKVVFKEVEKWIMTKVYQYFLLHLVSVRQHGTHYKKIIQPLSLKLFDMISDHTGLQHSSKQKCMFAWLSIQCARFSKSPKELFTIIKILIHVPIS